MARSWWFFQLRGLMYVLLIPVFLLLSLTVAGALRSWLGVPAVVAHIGGFSSVALLFLAARDLRKWRCRVRTHRDRQRAVAKLRALGLDKRDEFARSISFVKIYGIFDEAWGREVKAIQEVTLRTDGGLKPTDGVFGSEEWHQALASGRIPVTVLRGVISRVYWSGHGDHPSFDLVSASGETSWTRMGNDGAYIPGRAIKITYVLQEWKKPDPFLGSESQVVLKIEIEAR